MIQKVLIANRGEIALRIVRACRELDIRCIVVYSEADEQSLPVQLADEAICIGPAASADSYLKSDRIISAAEVTDADAIHPGYGFLAENADFAEQCHSCNIKFVGPSSDAIRKMGDKALAREMARKVHVPIIQGSESVIEDEQEAVKVAKRIGFPVIVKAAAGGGGRGMRVAHNAVTFAKEFHAARCEAANAFGHGTVYIEKYLENPRHIEIQILADHQGKIIHLGERDCSVQRRHQKIIEEAPSAFVTKDLRRKMGEAAIRIAEAAGYENAGTVEFLVDREGNFFFIEMNTRIQVEHPVTEEVTEIDLVKEQILIASGQALSYDQKYIQFHRHALECRICAEDTSQNFIPCPGTLSLYYPPGGPGVRVDSHSYSGYQISPYYDSMIGKVITSGATRTIAIDRMYRALNEYLIHGIKTTIPFTKRILNDPIFRQGAATVNYIENFIDHNLEL